MRQSSVFSVILLAAVLVAAPRWAMALDIVPSIEVTEIYTNNVDLQPDGFKEHEWVTRVAPRIHLESVGSVLSFDLDYTLESLFYAKESDRNEVHNQLQSSALLDVVGESLQLAASAEVEQINLRPERAVASSNINATGNRGDRRVVSVGPRWSQPVFGSSVLDGHVTASQINFSGDDQEVQDVDAIYGRIALHSDHNLWRRNLSYELAYEYHRYDYEISDEVVVQSSYLELGYELGERLTLLALAGLDSDIENIRSRSMKKSRWEMGVLSSTANSRLRATIGHRYFGTTYSFDWENRREEAIYRVSYQETPVTTELSSLERVGMPAILPGDGPQILFPETALDRPGSAMRYVLKRGDIGVSRDWLHTSVSAGVFVENRKDQVMQGVSASSSVALNSERAYGIVAQLDREMGARSTLAFHGSWTHRRAQNLVDCLPGDASCDPQRYTDKLSNLRLDWNYQLGLRTTLSSGIGWLDRRGSGALGEYDEFYARIQLAYAFQL